MEARYCKFCKTEHPLIKQYWDRLNYSPKCRANAAQKLREWKERNPGKFKEYSADFYSKHKQKVIQKNYEYAKKRKQIDPEYKLATLLRQRIGKAVKGNYKAGSAVRDLGCTVAEFKLYIESQFRDGMTWENHGSHWHLDHILPLANYQLSDRGTFRRLCNHTNYQPLLVSENLTKSNKDL